MSMDETSGPPDVSVEGSEDPMPPAPADGAATGGTTKWSNVIIAVATLLAIVSVFSIWARTQLLDTDEWVDLSAELVDEPAVQDAVATYLVEQVYADGNVTDGLEEALPENLEGLAGPLAGVIRGPLTDSVAALLDSERFQLLWAEVNRRAHESMVSVLRGEDVAGLSTSGGEVALELRSLVVAAGETIGLSEERLDAIPDDAGRVVIFESEELDTVQQAVDAFDYLAWALFVCVVLLYAIAVFIARGARLAVLRNVGLSLTVVGVVVVAAQAIARRSLADAIVENPAARPTADAVLTIGTALLRQQGWSLIIYGLLFVAFSMLLGPRRFAVATRHFIAPAFNASTGAVVAGTAVAVLALIWWSPGRAFNSWTTGLVLVALVAGAVVAMREQIRREFPDADLDEVENDLAPTP